MNQREVVALAVGRLLEGVPDTAFDAVTGVDRALRGDLVRGVLPQKAAFPRIGPLGVLADHLEVHRRGQAERPVVDVHVQLEPHPQQNPALHQPRRRGLARRRVADGAQQKCIEATPLGHRLVGQHRAIAQEAGGAEVVVGQLHLETCGFEHSERLGGDLGADAIAADHADVVWWVLGGGHEVVALRIGALGYGPAGSGQEKTAHFGGRLDARTETRCVLTNDGYGEMAVVITI